MTRSANVRQSSSRTAELSEMEGERKEKEREKERETKTERERFSWLFLYRGSAARRSRFTSEVGRSLARGYRRRVSGAGGPVRAAVINNAAINPGLSPAGMMAFGKKRRESLPPPHLYPPASFIPATPFVPLSLFFSLALSLFLSSYLSLSMREREGWLWAEGAVEKGRWRDGGWRGWMEWRSLVRTFIEERISLGKGSEEAEIFSFPLSLFLFLCLSISDHFFQPSPPCDLALPSLVHPLLSLHEAMFRYNLFRREILIGLADFKKNC